jgi:hypothetical protein
MSTCSRAEGRPLPLCSPRGRRAPQAPCALRRHDGRRHAARPGGELRER